MHVCVYVSVRVYVCVYMCKFPRTPSSSLLPFYPPPLPYISHLHSSEFFYREIYVNIISYKILALVAQYFCKRGIGREGGLEIINPLTI